MSLSIHRHTFFKTYLTFFAPNLEEDLRELEASYNNNNDDCADSSDGDTSEHALDFLPTSTDALMGDTASQTDGLTNFGAMHVDIEYPNPGQPRDGTLAFPTNFSDGRLGVEYLPMCVLRCCPKYYS